MSGFPYNYALFHLVFSGQTQSSKETEFTTGVGNESEGEPRSGPKQRVGDLKVNRRRKEYADQAVFVAKVRHMFVDILKSTQDHASVAHAHISPCATMVETPSGSKPNSRVGTYDFRR